MDTLHAQSLQTCPNAETLQTIAHKPPLSMGFYRQEYWNGLPWLSLGFYRQEYQNGLPWLSLGDLPDPEIEPTSPATSALQAESLPLNHLGQVRKVNIN